MQRAFLPSLVASLTIALPGAVPAQRGAPPFDGPRGAYSFQLSDGEPVSFYLEWARELDLTEPQKKQLIEIRRKLRATNAPFVRQLDSLRQYAGVDLSERGRISEGDREALQRFQKWSAPVADSIRVNNDGARRDIKAVLAAAQLGKADSIAVAMRDARGRRPNNGPRTEIPRGAPPNEYRRPTG